MNGATFAQGRALASQQRAWNAAYDVLIHRLGNWRYLAQTICEHNYRTRRIVAAIGCERLSLVPPNKMWPVVDRLEALAKEVGV